MRLTAGEREDIRNRIDMARRHAEEVWWPKVDLARRLYKGEHWDGFSGFTDGRLVVNYLFAHVEIKLAAISFRYPDFVIRTLREEDRSNEEFSRAALQFAWEETQAMADAARALQDRMVCGLGACLTTWELVTEEEAPKKGGDVYQGTRPHLPGDAEDATENPEAPQILARARVDEPRVSWIDPRCLLIPPESPRVTDRRLAYVGYTERVPLSHLKARKNYRVPRDLSGSAEDMRSIFPDRLSNLGEADVPWDLRRVDVDHYFEWTRRLHVVMARGHDTPLLVSRWPWPFDRYPIRFLIGPGPTESFWPESPLAQLAHAQQEINQARSLLSHHQRASTRKLQVQGTLSPKAQRALESAGVLSIVPTQPGQKIEPIQHAQLQPEVFQSLGQAMEDLQVLGGLSAYEAYQEPTKRQTVFEAQQVAQAGQGRAERLRDDYEKFLASLGQDTLSWMQQYSGATKTMPIRDRSGKVLRWGDYTKEDLSGDFLVEVYVGSTQPPTRQRQLEQFGFFLQALTNAVTATIRATQIGIDLKPVIRQIFAAIPEIRDVDKIVPETPSGMPGGMGDTLSLLSGQPGGPASPIDGPDMAAGLPTAPNGSISDEALMRVLSSLGMEDLARLTQME